MSQGTYVSDFFSRFEGSWKKYFHTCLVVFILKATRKCPCHSFMYQKRFVEIFWTSSSCKYIQAFRIITLAGLNSKMAAGDAGHIHGRQWLSHVLWLSPMYFSKHLLWYICNEHIISDIFHCCKRTSDNVSSALSRSITRQVAARVHCQYNRAWTIILLRLTGKS